MSKLTQADLDEIMSQRGKGNSDIELMFLTSAYSGELMHISWCLDEGYPVDMIEHLTGMSALHIAVGRNNLELTKLLVERGASFFPDRQGRWPSTIAAMCEVSDDLCDYIAEAEAKAEDATEGV